MKKLISISILATLVAITSCGKKVTASFSSGSTPTSAYHKFESANNESSTTEVILTESNLSTASVSENNSENKTELNKTVSKIAVAREQLATLDKSKMTTKQAKLVAKLDKKLAKFEKKSSSKGGISGLTKTGLIIAILGLALMILAVLIAAGGISWLFWVLGGLALVVGLLIVLYDVLTNM